MHVAVTGSSGLIGTALIKRLGALGHQITRVVRRTPRPGEAHWNPAERTIDVAALHDVDAVVNLAGAGIGDHRWTDEYKRELVDSRIKGTELLATTLASLERRPMALLSGSAIGFYGPNGAGELDETDSAGSGFLAELSVAWEQATATAEAAGVRVVHLRTGIVLSADGGALRKQLPLFKLGLGGKMASGKQYQSWISIDDEVGAIIHLLTSDLTGPVNLTSPNPVTQAEFAQTLARVLKRPSFIPIPSFGPKLLLGAELAENLLFTGQRVVPTALLADGYVFANDTLEATLRAMLGRPG